MRILLWPFALLYGLGINLRNLLFDIGWLSSRRFSLPVICIGNLKTGGTGKSPMVAYLAKLVGKEKNVAILSRGYGRKSKGYRLISKDDTALMSGDEPLQYAQTIKNVTVAVSEKRADGIENLLLQKNKPEVIILDDAFQHRYVRAGLNILLTEYNDLYVDDHLLPVGNLRENKAGAKRANAIVITKCPADISLMQQELIRSKLHAGNSRKIFFSYIRYREELILNDNSKLPLKNLKNKNILLLAGIADPSLLLKFLQEHSSTVALMNFPDHHTYTIGDMIKLKQKFDKFAAADQENALIITTGKDSMRLQNAELKSIIKNIPLAVIDIDIDFAGGSEEFNKYIYNYVRQN